MRLSGLNFTKLEKALTKKSKLLEKSEPSPWKTILFRNPISWVMNETKFSNVSKSFRIRSGALRKTIVSKTYFAFNLLNMTKNIEKARHIIGSIENNNPTRIEFIVLELIKLKDKSSKIQNAQMSLLPLEIRKTKGQDVKIIKINNLDFITLFKTNKIINKLKQEYSQIDKFIGKKLIWR